ncbi:MAG: D-amino-acid transaminase [Hyphomicrobium sp.]
MTRVVYVNGRYVPYADAAIHAEDRGFQFADAVYEVCEVRGGRLVDEARHITRLWRSLGEIGIEHPMSAGALGLVMRQTIRRNRVSNGLVYLQVTRGEARRDFLFPDPAVTPPTLVCLARRLDPDKIAARASAGIGVKTMPDNRWGRCDLKTVMLLPACLAKDAARQEGAAEAWFVDGKGLVTEGAASNAWIIDSKGMLITRPANNGILAGVTRAAVMDAIKVLDISLEERGFTVAEAHGAVEAFITSASGTVMPVVTIDGRPIGNGKPGPRTLQLRDKFHQFAQLSNN